MPKLKNRTAQIPNGFKFHVPQTNWNAPPWASFDAIVKAVIGHRAGNPYLARKHNWSTDYNQVAEEVDAFNAQICLSHGWNDFISGEANFPKAMPLSRWRSGVAAAAGAVKKTVAGVKVISDWLGSGLKPVELPLAEARALVCSTCPQNKEGNFWQGLDASAAARVKTLIAVKNDMALKTSLDEKLQSCLACDCHLPLKVWTPLPHIKANMSQEVEASLDPKCWITKE